MFVVINIKLNLLIFCRIENQMEHDCFANAFVYLASHLPKTSLFEPQSSEGPVQGVTEAGPVGLGSQESMLPVAEAESDLYPCMMAVLGSAFTFHRVD